MNIRKMIILLIFTAFWVTPYISSQATDRGKKIVYLGSEEGRVIFDGQIHASKGISCNDCHTNYANTAVQLFETQKKGLISMADHESGTKCFVCHNDQKAFSDCKGCHFKMN